LSDPQATAATKNGMKLWVDLSDKKWGFPRYCHNCFMAKRSYLDANREQAVNVLKAVIEGLVFNEARQIDGSSIDQEIPTLG
jgi:hypothetical protein